MRLKVIISIFYVLLASSYLVACGSNVEDATGEKQEVESVNVYKSERNDDVWSNTLLMTFNEGDNAIKKFLNATKEVKYQTSSVDMPPNDYLLEFVVANDHNATYSLWLTPGSSRGFIMRDSFHFAQLHPSTAKSLISLIEEKKEDHTLTLDENITKIEVFHSQTKERIISYEDPSFIESLVSKLNEASGIKLSEHGDLAVSPYKVVFKNRDTTVMELGFSQTKDEAQFVMSDPYMRFTIDTILPNVPMETPMTKEEIEEGNEREKELEEQYKKQQPK